MIPDLTRHLSQAPTRPNGGRRLSPISMGLVLSALTSAALGLPQGSSAQVGDREAAMEILESTAARYAELVSLCADFSQTLEVTLLDRRVDSSGELCQAAPDRFSMRFRDPDGDLVVADGEWIWIYYPSTDPRQVLRAPMTSGTRRFDFHQEFLDRPRERYRAALAGTERLDGVETRILSLDPIGIGPFLRARIWVDPSRGLIMQIRTEEENGSIRTLRLRNLRLNPEIPAEIFRFEPPDGADVITRG